MDYKSVGLYLTSTTISSIGIATLNVASIVIGIVAFISTIVYNAIKIYKELNKKQ